MGACTLKDSSSLREELLPYILPIPHDKCSQAERLAEESLLRTHYVCFSHVVSPPLCDPMNQSSLDSSAHVILQAKILEWVAIPFSRGSPLPRGSNPGLLCWRWIIYHLSHQGSLEFIIGLITELCESLDNSLRKRVNMDACYTKWNPQIFNVY